jgi:hypothetical protein
VILLIPKVIHIGGRDSHNLCGEVVNGSWSEKYLDDKVARTLPLCEDCVETYQEIHGDEKVNRLLNRWNNPDNWVVERVETKAEVVDNDTQTNGRSVMTLRQYLES